MSLRIESGYLSAGLLLGGAGAIVELESLGMAYKAGQNRQDANIALVAGDTAKYNDLTTQAAQAGATGDFGSVFVGPALVVAGVATIVRGALENHNPSRQSSS